MYVVLVVREICKDLFLVDFVFGCMVYSFYLSNCLFFLFCGQEFGGFRGVREEEEDDDVECNSWQFFYQLD